MRPEFACDRCDERRGIHPTPAGRRCDQCLTDAGFPSEETGDEHALVADGGAVDVEADDPLATFQAALLPNWSWEVYDVEERGAEVVTDPDPATGEHGTTETAIYFGRTKSPNTFGRWEVGRFSRHELETAGAFRTDADTGRWP